MLHILKNLPFIFFIYKKIIYIYKKIIGYLIFNKNEYDRKVDKISEAFLYLSEKKKFIKEKAFLPFNGQKHRLEIINKIFKSKKIGKIYETGTYHGSTTEFLAKYKLPINTCEISPPYFFIAKDRLKKYKNIKIFNSESYLFLKKNISKNNKISFFYLDAHNDTSTSPLLLELNTIFSKSKNFLILIDDFQVPHDKEYGYDSTGGHLLKTNYIKKFLHNSNINYYFPKKRCTYETGLKRGSIYICKGRESIKLCNSIKELIKY